MEGRERNGEDEAGEEGERHGHEKWQFQRGLENTSVQ